MSNDEDYAERILAVDDDEDKPRRGPSLAQWTAEVDLLAGIYDRLGDVIAATIASSGQKPPDPPPAPRPQTAIDRARRQARYRKHLDLVAQFTPAERGSDAIG